MAFVKITPEDVEGKGNVGQPDTPLLTTTEMQEQMDSLPNLIIEKYNDLVDALGNNSAAQYVGCTVPDGYTASENVFSVIEAVASEAKQSVTARHTHPNKSLLDSLSDQTISDITALLTMFAGIDGLENSLSGDADKLATSLAVKAYVDNFDIKAKILNAVYPIGSVYITTLVDPDSIFGTSGHWELIKTDNGIKFYKRIS